MSADDPLTAAVLYSLRRQPDGMTAADLADELGTRLVAVVAVLVELGRAGRVEHHGGAVGGTWHLVEVRGHR